MIAVIQLLADSPYCMAMDVCAAQLTDSAQDEKSRGEKPRHLFFLPVRSLDCMFPLVGSDKALPPMHC